MADATVTFAAKDLNLGATIDKLKRELGATQAAANNASKVFDISFGKIAGAVSGAYAAVMGFRESFEFIGDSIKKSSDLAETMNKVNVIFGSSAGSVSDFASAAVEQLGMTRQEALDGASTFAVFGKASGLAGDSLVGFSKNLVQLSTDFASFYNTSPAEAIQAIGAALRGESEPIRKYGVLLDDATLKAEAMKLGLYDGSGALDSQAKSLAAYNAILSQSGIAQGDFANTSDSLSNQLKIVTASFSELKTEIGNELQPVAKSFVEFLNQEMIPALRDSVKEYKEFAASTHDAAMGNYETNDAAGKATGGLDLLRTMMVSVIGPINDLVNGTTEFRDRSNAAAEAAKKNADAVTEVGKAAAAAAPQLDKSATNTESASGNISNLAASAQDASGKLTKAGLEAAAASGQFTGLGSNAEQTGATITDSLTINSGFKSQIDGISSAFSDVNAEIAGTKPLLESNFSLTDSITGKVEEQTQGIGKLNEQLEKSKELEELIKDIKTVRAEKEKEAAAKQAERQADLRENLELDLQSLKAQISGNAEEQKAVQYKKDYNAALKQAISAGMGKSEAAEFADQIARARQEQAEFNKQAVLSRSILENIKEAEAKDSVDKGGRLEKQAQKQISQGNFTGARNTARKVQQNEIEQSIRGTGQNRDRRSLSDIGKDFGLRQQMNEKGSDFAKRVKDAKEGNSFADKFGRSVRKGETKSDQDSLSKLGKDKDWFSKKLNVDQPNKDGSKGGDSGGSGGDKNKPQTLDAMVSALLELVKKIEPKLPTSALAA
jgi:hypothetical protein